MASPHRQHETLNGQDAAALIAAGAGIFALGLATPIGAWLVTARHLGYTTARPLLTAAAFALWGIVWLTLRRQWRTRSLKAQNIVLLAGALILLGLLLGTPIMAWFWPSIHLP